ncbi:polysaccharide biosynthesis/export family protein [Ulvibacter antarcticus]|uniref:Polysaccharide export outer membrane protein n=1 Tax=Ulvibacter antarcticus TaxID=442714 RepID=A0A3L9YX08_9FLAO|nr:polysaccharide biosynthesis/export family protein [Ulvibacter antarcticus]RMA58962.1 polysaccharide export outer membrane protein [Ulvibacter antarcticus]
MKKVIILSGILLLLLSCASKKEIIYFQDIEKLDLQNIEHNFEPIIEPNDILYISISAINEEVVRPFLGNSEATSTTVTNTNPGLRGYLVTAEGYIRFPVLGDIIVSGNTRGEVVDKLKADLSVYIKDVVVDVRIMNFTVTVLGEVLNPGVFNVNDERISLPEAIALAGDFTEDGKRKDVLIIREQNGKRRVARIDFTTSDLFNSPYYFLKQNDVVYVEPSLRGVKKSGFIPDIPALLSVVTIILSSVILLTR